MVNEQCYNNKRQVFCESRYKSMFQTRFESHTLYTVGSKSYKNNEGLWFRSNISIVLIHDISKAENPEWEQI